MPKAYILAMVIEWAVQADMLRPQGGLQAIAGGGRRAAGGVLRAARMCAPAIAL